MSENKAYNWLQVRALINRVPQPLSGAINLALVLLASEIVWYLLFSPTGPVSLYTPNVGLAFVITMLMVIHWGMDAFDFWPFSRPFLLGGSLLVRGFALLAVSVTLALLVMFGLYYDVIGRFGAIFFSGPQLIASGGLGQYSQTAIENGCYAQIMMNTCIIFSTILWLTAFQYAPWTSQGPVVRPFRSAVERSFWPPASFSSSSSPTLPTCSIRRSRSWRPSPGGARRALSTRAVSSISDGLCPPWCSSIGLNMLWERGNRSRASRGRGCEGW